MAEQREKILKIEYLDISFKTTAGLVHAIRGVDIDLYKGEPDSPTMATVSPL